MTDVICKFNKSKVQIATRNGEIIDGPPCILGLEYQITYFLAMQPIKRKFYIFFSVGIPPVPLRPNCDNMENLPVLRSPRMQQPKTLMVTSSSITGENFHTGFTGKFLKI